MTKNKSLNSILQKPMNRKEFLQTSATAILFIVGGGAIVQSIAKSFMSSNEAIQPTNSTPRASSATGYGGSVYGGRKTIS